MSTVSADQPDPTLLTTLADLTTEAVNTDLAELDTLSTAQLLTVMNDGDRTVPDAVRAATPSIAVAVDAIVERLDRGGRLIYVGSGTAGRIGALDASEIPPTFGVSGVVEAVMSGGQEAFWVAKEGAEDDGAAAVEDLTQLALTSADVVVGVSASGRTPYAVAAVEHARAVGAFTVGLACNDNSVLAGAAECGIEVVVGPELVAGSTRLKAGTAQKLVLNMLSTATMVKLGKTFGNVMVDLRATNEKLVARSVRIITQITDADAGQASAALTQAGGSVKLALLSLLADLPVDSAAALLTEHRGRLRAALSNATSPD